MARIEIYLRLKLPIDFHPQNGFLPLKLRKNRRIATKIVDSRVIDRAKVQEKD
jgi:hypothetical protein